MYKLIVSLLLLMCVDVSLCGPEHASLSYTMGCYNKQDNGASYRGFKSVTDGLQTCNPWKSQDPHFHTRTPENNPHAGLDRNYCRNPDGSDRPWCYTMNPVIRWQYCDIPICTAECYEEYDKGASYRGWGLRTTETGKTCQAWSSNSPHPHTSLTDYPDAGLEDRFCRNPDGKDRPWCYTTDKDTEWEYCNVSVCAAGCYDSTDNGKSYRGTVRTTKSGKTCQAWESQSPHGHTRNNFWFPNAGLDKNYCRNPDGENGPWCYTTDKDTRWEYCDVPFCESKCMRKEDKGASYRGDYTIQEKNGPRTILLKCRNWHSVRNNIYVIKADFHPYAGLSHNHCRNPNNRERPWCYTFNQIDKEPTWEYCDVPVCNENCHKKEDKGASYRGTQATTKSGRTCQKWSSQHPHGHSRTPENNLNKGLDENYCRNPDGENEPWCYTTDPNKRWEECGVPIC